MRLHLLGVNGPYPAPGGATSGYLLEAGSKRLQFDLGSGVLSRLTSVCPPEELDGLFLSHWHFDHTCDLLPLIYRLEAVGAVLPVWAPEDASSALRRIAAGASCLELHTAVSGEEVLLDEVRIRFCPARHPVPGIGFRVEAEGKALGYTGDTNTLPELKACYQNCDLLLADGLFPISDWAESKPHLSAELAAELARDAGATRLVLTHLNPVYAPSRLLSEARTVFSDVLAAQAGMALQL